MSTLPLKSHFKNSLALLHANYRVLLIGSIFLLFCTKTLFNIPFFLVAFLGLYCLIKSPLSLFENTALRALLICFLCLWLPQLASLPDAVNPSRAMKTTFSYVHFFFAGIFIILALQERGALQKINLFIFSVLAFWAIDALLQFFVGINLFGYPYEQKGQLSGMFYPKIRLGHVVAALLPVSLEFVRQHGHHYRWSWLLLAVSFTVLLLSGKRAAWIMAGIGCVAYFIYFCLYCRTIRLKALLVPSLIVVCFLSAVVWQHEPINDRINKSLNLFSGDYELINNATARRLPLWKTAADIFKDNPVNGVGPRGYRFVFADYADKEGYWMQYGRQGSTHPHQALLEIAAETGGAGLLGFILFWAYLIFFVAKQLRYKHSFVPWAICAGLAWLPLNAHMAFYGSYWSSVGWWILCVALAQLFQEEQAD